MTALNEGMAQSLQEPGCSIGRPGAQAILDLVWTASLRALGEGETYASAVLRVEARWQAADTESDVELTGTILAGAREACVALPRPLRASIDERANWTHLRIRGGSEDIVLASFQQGRLVYCTGALPRHAGLRGGSYDSPTGTLELGTGREHVASATCGIGRHS